MKSRFLCAFLALIFAFAALAADFSTPMGRVKDSVSKVLAILQDQSLDEETAWQQIAAVIDQGFDFRSMSQSVLANHWESATPEERERFTQFFSQYIEETYRSKIQAYSGQQILYKSETINGERAVVKTAIVTDTAIIPIDFKLKKNDNDWFAYDVVIEGISLVSNYRTTFAAIVKNDGMDGLLSDIQGRIEKYKQEHPQAPAAAPAESAEKPTGT